MDIFILCIYFLIVKTNDFRGDLSDISAQTAKLVGLCSIEKHWACNFMSDQFSNLSSVAVILALKNLGPSVYCFGRYGGSMVLLGKGCGKKGSSGTGPKPKKYTLATEHTFLRNT